MNLFRPWPPRRKRLLRRAALLAAFSLLAGCTTPLPTCSDTQACVHLGTPETVCMPLCGGGCDAGTRCLCGLSCEGYRDCTMVCQ